MLEEIREQRDGMATAGGRAWRHFEITDQRKEPAQAAASSMADVVAANPRRDLLFLWLVGLMLWGIMVVTLKGGS